MCRISLGPIEWMTSCGYASLTDGEQLLVVLDAVVGVVAALQHHLGGAEVDRLAAPAQDLLHRVRPALGVLGRAVEGAELARGDAHVRVVDVAVDQVGDDAVRVAPAADRVGRLAQRVERRVGVEQQRLLGRDPPAVGAALQDARRSPGSPSRPEAYVPRTTRVSGAGHPAGHPVARRLSASGSATTGTVDQGVGVLVVHGGWVPGTDRPGRLALWAERAAPARRRPSPRPPPAASVRRAGRLRWPSVLRRRRVDGASRRRRLTLQLPGTSRGPVPSPETGLEAAGPRRTAG